MSCELAKRSSKRPRFPPRETSTDEEIFAFLSSSEFLDYDFPPPPPSKYLGFSDSSTSKFMKEEDDDDDDDDESLIHKKPKDDLSSTPEWKLHVQQIKESGGFDVDVFPEISCYSFIHPTAPFLPSLVDLAIQKFNTDHNASYEVTKVEKAVASGTSYNITFQAKSKYDKEGTTFQARCIDNYQVQYCKFVRLKEVKGGPIIKRPSFYKNFS